MIKQVLPTKPMHDLDAQHRKSKLKRVLAG
jgi:hypothetical protein